MKPQELTNEQAATLDKIFREHAHRSVPDTGLSDDFLEKWLSELVEKANHFEAMANVPTSWDDQWSSLIMHRMTLGLAWWCKAELKKRESELCQDFGLDLEQLPE